MPPRPYSLTPTEYGWKDEQQTCAHDYILPTVIRWIQKISRDVRPPLKILDIGCGNGYVASKIAELGHSVWAVDESNRGLEIGRSAYPGVQFRVCSIYDDGLINIIPDLVDCVISTEVLEHLFYPKKLIQQSHRVLKSGGFFLLSTPYHGYFKNLALSLYNGWDKHFEVDCDGGHIKFFSKQTLKRMAFQAGFGEVMFEGAGRLPWLWKSMVMIAKK